MISIVQKQYHSLADAVITQKQQPAVIVDCGTATTINLMRADGAFLGGAILPGFALCSQALHHYTEVLPLVSIAQIVNVSPETQGHAALGKNTQAAIMSGIFWGQVGAIRELTARLRDQVKGEPQLLLSGGGSRLLVPHLTGATHYPYLALPLTHLSCMQRHVAHPQWAKSRLKCERQH